MINKKIPVVALVALTTSLSVGCSKKTETQENTSNIENTNKENVVSTKHIQKSTFKDLGELKTFSKNVTSEFSEFLAKNSIENIVSPDGTLTVNTKMSYEKYTKNYSQLAYTKVETDFNTGTGYLKSGIKVNFHIDETLTLENNFAKAIFTIVNAYNPVITEKQFAEELINATSNSSSTSDYQFNLGINGITLNMRTNDNNERELALSIRQEIEFPKATELIKEYKTVKEFKEDSEKLPLKMEEKVGQLNEKLNTLYGGSSDSINLTLNSIDSNTSDDFGQSLEVEYNAENINFLPKELLNGLYEIVEEMISKEKLSKIITLDEFKAYFESLYVYSGVKTSDTLMDENGEPIVINSLPLFDGIIDLSVNLKHHTKEESKEDNTESTTEDSNESSIEENANSKDENSKNEENNTSNNNPSNKQDKYDMYIKINLNIPVMAEGVDKI